jgi:XTP/dITP diphosphohydrolase
MLRLLLATRNRGKLAEMRRLLEGLDLDVVGIDEVGGAPQVVEDGHTFEANAIKKARQTALATGLLTVADDSGLEVDALGGAPGVWSARFAGEGASDADNNRLLLERLDGVPLADRTARFRCVLALYDPRPQGTGQGVPQLGSGTCEGHIIEAPRGLGGFGYDPLFVPLGGGGRTMAEMNPDEKHRLSHRGAAAHLLRDLLLPKAVPNSG